ncbi:MAG: ASCH domain-containing protein [Spirochaetales bacterium]|nr:ASCH domain-containing protein [Spirochaetales bacterium]
MIPTKITFFEFLIPFVVSGKKTITIRDESESHYVPGTIVEVHALETDKRACTIEIESVEPLKYDDINTFHAQQEYMDLPELKRLIREIYPDIEELFVISYKLIP